MDSGQAGAQRTRGPLNERPSTEMEVLTGNLASTAHRMKGLADKLEHRINGFMQAPATIGGAEPATPPDPAPGTLGALKRYHERIDDEANRIDRALDTLAGII